MVHQALANLRLHLGAKLGLIPRDLYRFVWIVDFPLLEYDEAEGRFVAVHHPFTAPRDEDIPILKERPREAKAKAEAPKMEMPKPGPEVKKLGYFVGTWTSEGELKENPFGMPAGKFTSTDKCEWFSGGYQVVCHSTGKGPMGAVHGKVTAGKIQSEGSMALALPRTAASSPIEPM